MVGVGELNLIRSILYIDDEVGCLNLFQETFGGGNDVRTATTLAEGRRMLEERPADIIISDQTMPEITGTDFLREVAVTHPPSYRVLLTGSIRFGEVIPEIGDGTVHFFAPKPWTQEDMRQMFERAGVHLAQYRNAH
jgi:DNA-binding NtrC family response regulator